MKSSEEHVNRLIAPVYFNKHYHDFGMRYI